MNKKLMAAAVAGVLVAPAAFAQSSNVQLYGRINGGLDYYKAPGATVGGGYGAGDTSRDGRFRVFDNSSRVGLRGTEDLGGGLKAIFQIESGVNIDAGGDSTQAGSTNGSTGFWGTRDTYGGVQAAWGRLTYGRQSMYWVNGVNAQYAGSWINTEIPWTNGTSLGRVSGGGIVAARVSNVIQYTSPTWAGNNFTVSFSPGQGGTGTNQEVVQNKNASIEPTAQIWGLTWRGTFGPIYGQLDWVGLQGNKFGATAVGNPTPGLEFKQKAQAYKAGVSWGYLPGARIGIIWVRQQQNAASGLQAGQTVHKDGWTVNWSQTFGNIQAMAQYGWTGDIKSCAVANVVTCGDTSAQGFMVGARYLMSKRTWIYLSYNQVTNKANDFIDYTGGGITSTTGAPTPYGADPRILAFGFFHHF
jgi:predicted porin